MAYKAPGPQATMRDVADRAGVSAMTVSRVLRDDARVTPENRERVLAAVADLGYRRNEAARSLRIGSSGLLGLVVTNLANPFYSQLALGVEALTAEHGMTVVLGNTGEDVARELELVGELVSHRVTGMIVVPAGGEHPHLRPDRVGGIPVVLAARPPSGAELDCVLVDDFGGMAAATRRLIAAGHTRLGFLGLPPHLWTGAERFRGFSAALAESGLPVDQRYVRLGLGNAASAREAAAELLALPEPPTALLAANSRATLGALRAVIRSGAGSRAAPGTALAGFDDFELADVVGRPLTLVGYDPREIGRHAAGLLLDRLSGAYSGPARRIVVPTEIVEYEGPDLLWWVLSSVFPS